MLTIQYASGEVISFKIGADLWYLRLNPGPPVIYDSKLKKQIIPNMDKWFQAKTGHRYSYSTVCDMGAAFASGLACGYSTDDIAQACVMACVLTVDTIFKTERAADYRREFWIEMMDPVKIISFAHKLRENLDIIRKKHGDDVLFNYLCRLWKMCGFHDPGNTTIFERLVERLNLKPKDPDYPDVSKLNSETAECVVGKIMSQLSQRYKSVPQEIIKNTHDLQARKL